LFCCLSSVVVCNTPRRRNVTHQWAARDGGPVVLRPVIGRHLVSSVDRVVIVCRWSWRGGGRASIRAADTETDPTSLRQPAARTSARYTQRINRNRKNLPGSPPCRVHRRKVGYCVHVHGVAVFRLDQNAIARTEC